MGAVTQGHRASDARLGTSDDRNEDHQEIPESTAIRHRR